MSPLKALPIVLILGQWSCGSSPQQPLTSPLGEKHHDESDSWMGGQLAFAPLPLVDETDPASLEIPGEGARRPLVVILEAGSYQCTHTKAAETGIETVLRDVPEAARYYLHSPQPGQKNAYLLAVAASAAQRQGRFWEFHRLVMAQTEPIDQDRILYIARRVGLDVPTFLKDLKRPVLKEHVERNRTLVAAMGLVGTPVFLVNGVPVLGWPGQDKFEGLVREKLAQARKARGQTDDLEALHRQVAAVYQPYKVAMEKGVQWDRTELASAPPEKWRRYRVSLKGGLCVPMAESKPLDAAPAPACAVTPTPTAPKTGTGGLRSHQASGTLLSSSLVTVVEYLGPSCAHSKHAWEQISRLQARFGEKVKFVVKLSPRFASTGRSVAIKSRDVRAVEGNSDLAVFDAYSSFVVSGCDQGAASFLDSWFKTGDIRTAQRAAGDVCPECLRDSGSEGENAPRLERLAIEIRRLDATGTPTYFVNGIRRVGYQDDLDLGDLIEKEISLAMTLTHKGVQPREVYEFLTGHGFSRSFLQPDVTAVHYGDVPAIGGGDSGNAPGKAAAGLLVFWRFHSAFCRNLLPHLLNLQNRRPNLSITVKPLVLSKNDLAEAVAYLCAAKRGLAVPMLRALAAAGVSPDKDALSSLGAGIGIEPGEIAACMSDPAILGLVRSLEGQAGALGIKGAPVVFVGGHRVSVPSGLDYYSLLAATQEG